MTDKELFPIFLSYILCKFRTILCLKVLPISWSISINLSRKSLTEATLRRMMGWRGSIHCSFPWPSWRPRLPTLCSAWHPPKHNVQLTLPPQLAKAWMTAPVGVRHQKVAAAEPAVRPFLQPTPDLTPAGSPFLSVCEAQLWCEVCKNSCLTPRWGPTAAAFQHHGQQPSKPVKQRPQTHFC